jgi:hypothetical protein
MSTRTLVVRFKKYCICNIFFENAFRRQSIIIIIGMISLTIVEIYIFGSYCLSFAGIVFLEAICFWFLHPLINGLMDDSVFSVS